MARDPVCGMNASEEKGPSSEYEGTRYYFCSQFCKTAFEKNPQRFVDFLKTAVPARMESEAKIAYFSMEIGIHAQIPTYSGGLGILAGDTLRACADMRIPIVGTTLLYRKGYFHQKLDEEGNQQEEPTLWNPEDDLEPLNGTVEVHVEGRTVRVCAWLHIIKGSTGFVVPVLFLDTDVEGNAPEDRSISDNLYGGDTRYRLAQELVLGVGGVRMLEHLGYDHIERYHMNEGHASLLILELLRKIHTDGTADWDYESVRHACVFTTHTPVPAGHDKFDYPLVERVVGDSLPADMLHMLAGDDVLNMTLLALNMSHYVNGVAKRHGEVSREMFPSYPIDSITNGVHSSTWVCESFQSLFDAHIPGWRAHPSSLRYGLGIDEDHIWEAHAAAKRCLIDHVNQMTNAGLDRETMTIGFARRATPYKRGNLVFTDLQALRQISQKAGRIQFVFAGKAHPKDSGGKDLIRSIVAASRQLGSDVPVVYLPNYDMDTARMLVSGVDLWLNTPRKPMEASGTSGMKAAHNGVPSLSVLDGWWLEGHIEGVTGWSIGSAEPVSNEDAHEAAELYTKLERVILPLYYNDRDKWIEIMRHVIALNASFFNTHRMVQQYTVNAYL